MLHLEEPITLFDVAEVVEHAFYKAFILFSTVKGFEVTDIYPNNENVFRVDENFSSCVTYRLFHINSTE